MSAESREELAKRVESGDVGKKPRAPRADKGKRRGPRLGVGKENKPPRKTVTRSIPPRSAEFVEDDDDSRDSALDEDNNSEKTKKKRWRFNSSVAEMTNAWFGEFQSIAREMRKDRYEFFLDEMIKQRNRVIIAKLEEDGQEPGRFEREELLPRSGVA